MVWTRLTSWQPRQRATWRQRRQHSRPPTAATTSGYSGRRTPALRCRGSRNRGRLWPTPAANWNGNGKPQHSRARLWRRGRRWSQYSSAPSTTGWASWSGVRSVGQSWCLAVGTDRAGRKLPPRKVEICGAWGARHPGSGLLRMDSVRSPATHPRHTHSIVLASPSSSPAVRICVTFFLRA